MLCKSLSIFIMVVVVLTFTWRTEAQYVKDGLIGYWPFDANTISGKTIEDVVGNNDGVINFNVKLVEGKVGDALEFDGENDRYVATQLKISPAEYKELTMMAWAKPYRAHEAWCSVMNGDDGNWDRGYGYRLDTWEIQVGHGGDWQPGPIIEINKWQHTAVVYTVDNVIFYLNGERFDFGSPVTPGTSTQPLIIGDDIPCGPNCAFPGAIDEVLIYSRALSDAEVRQNFTATGTSVSSAGKLTTTWGEIKASK